VDESRTPPPPATSAADCLAGGGELGARMRAIDWSKTALGPVESWPQSLRTCIRIVLTSRQPMFVWWGDELINLYNDAYKSIVGGKHPQALGQPARVVWREIWDQILPRVESAMRANEGTYDEALFLLMERNGYPEETYYTFSYSPVPHDRGGNGGILCANSDDTRRIISERQLALLRELSAGSAEARTVEDVCRRVAETLASNPRDLPFALLYLADASRGVLSLCATAGITAGAATAPLELPLDGTNAGLWPAARALSSGEPVLLETPAATFGALPTGAWDRPPGRAILLPLTASGRVGALVVGLNPFRLFDENYEGFLRLVASQIGASMANAQAYEEERERAEALAELDRAKTAFFSNVSHEFRTPLTLMLGPTEEALAAPGQALSGESLKSVHRNELRLLKLVNTLLDFSRIEAGRTQAAFAPTDLAALTRELASAFESAITRGGLRFEVDCPPLDEDVYVDRDMWEKVVLNLVSNAFKFTFEGTIRVALRRAGAEVELRVADSGVGIPADHLPRIFERFHRIEGMRSRTHEGSGIGLALVHDLVELHGGGLRVESAVGQGTTFFVTLPLGHAHLPAERLARERTLTGMAVRAESYVAEALRWLPDAGEEASEAAAEGAMAAGAHIVVADDNADMRAYVTRLLRQQGWAVTPVGDGEAALAAVRARRPDLVVTDVMMPLLDGFGLMRRLRAEADTATIPIILLSARAGEEARVEGLDEGANDYLVKPFSARELVARVQAQLATLRLRQAEERNRERLTRLFRHAPVAIAMLRGPEHVFELTNDPYRRLIGKRDVVGKPIREALPELADQGIFELLDRAYQSGEPYLGNELSVELDRDGTLQELCFTFLYQPVPDAEGRTEGILVVAIDVTEQVQARQRILDREARLRLALEASHLGDWTLDLATGVFERSARHDEIFGYEEPRPRWSYQTFLEHLFEEDRAAVDTSFRRAIELSGRWHFEGRIRRVDGTVGWIAVHGRVQPTDDGEAPRRMLGTIGDITDRRRVESERQVLYEREQAARKEAERARDEATRLANLVEESGEFIGFADLDGNGLYLNPAGRRLVGIDHEDEVRQKHAEDFFAPEDRAAARAVIAQAFAHGKVDTEFRFRNFKTGALIPVQWNVFAMRNESGKPYALGTVTRDLTAAQIARREAESANRAKDEFLAMLGHELRNPLAPISTALHLMRLRGTANADKERQVIERQVSHLVRLVDDLLDVSRITRGKIELKKERVELAEIAAQAIEMTGPLLEQGKHRFDVAVAPTGLPVVGDPNRLAQVLANLLSNAAKYTEPGGSIALRAACENGDVVVRVRDSGVGIGADMLPRVFDLFSQERQSLARSQGGLGLGLAIVRSLTTMHGGTVSAHSEGVGRGSEFVVRLPAASGASAAARPAQRAPTPVPRPMHGPRVLIVDDNIDAAELLAESLQHLGCTTRLAHDGPSGFRAAEDFHPEVALLDIGLPVMDGYELARRFRDSPTLKQVKLVAVTGYGQESDRRRSLAAGFDSHIVKPLNAEQIEAVISEMTTRNQLASE
jgi:PAS domain S-box-containing protein